MTAGRSISYTSIRAQEADWKGISTALFSSTPLRVCSCEVLFIYPEGGRKHMSVRLQGQLLLVGAIGAILASLLIFLLPGPDGIGGPGSIPTNVVFVISGLFLLIGLPALYRAQAKQIGILGLVGVVLLWVATVFLLLVLSGVQILDVSAPGSIPHPGGEGPPPLAIIPLILGVLLTLIGGVIVGITTIRAHVFAAAIGWILLVSPVLLLLTAPLSGLLSEILTSICLGLFYAGLAWAGATLSFRGNATKVSTSSAQPS
jgi:hypothetical protein